MEFLNYMGLECLHSYQPPRWCPLLLAPRMDFQYQGVGLLTPPQGCPGNMKGARVSRSVISDSFDPMDCSPPSSSVCRILQARTLEWVAIPFSWGIFLTQGSNLGLLYCRQILYRLSHNRSPRSPGKRTVTLGQTSRTAPGLA